MPATLSVSLSALSANYRLLSDKVGTGTLCASVVKCNAYGLGVERIAPVLEAAGCRKFYVAHTQEGIQLRGLLPHTEIAVLHGFEAGEEALYPEYQLVPVLNTPEQLGAFRALARRRGQILPALLMLDTGMHRLGFSQTQVEALFSNPTSMEGIALKGLLSHLACGDVPSRAMNGEQRARLLTMASRFPSLPLSLSNSAGIFLGSDYSLQEVRPGIALYGCNPQGTETPNPMETVATLTAPILQIHTVEADGTCGYGATYPLKAGMHLATVPCGYGDGLLRNLSSRNAATAIRLLLHHADGFTPVPIAGRVSMDLMVLDVSSVAEAQLATARHVVFFGENLPLDTLAEEASTLAYEFLTRLGNRVKRAYR